jgi:hypothetical protein
MSEDGTPRLTYGELAPVEALSLVGNEVRAGILWTLAEARGERGNPPAIPFSELRRRVDADVDSSRFNYHLQQLVGHFVEHRGSGGSHPINEFTDRQENFASRGQGYALRPEGTMLTQVIRAGTSEGKPDVETFATGFDCHHCDTEVMATYRGWLAALQCPSCDHLYEYNITPPGLVAGSGAILDRMAAYNRAERRAAARGVCTRCACELDHRFLDPAEVNYPRGDRREVMVERGCSHCGNMDYLTAGEIVLPEPAVTSFFHQRGTDIIHKPVWEVRFAATDLQTSVTSRDPWHVKIEIRHDGDILRAAIDADLTVSTEVAE